MSNRLNKVVAFSAATMMAFLIAGTLILRLMSAHRFKLAPRHLTYSIYCVNRKYVISSRALDEIHLTGGAQACGGKGSYDDLGAAENDANELGGVGSACSCDEKLYVYCANRRVTVSTLSPAEMQQEPSYGSDVCEQPDDSLSRGGRKSPAEPTDDAPKSQDDLDAPCECPKPADGKQADAQGDNWAFFVLGALLITALLIVLRLRQHGEPPEDIFHPLSK